MKFTVMDGAETDKCMIHSKKKHEKTVWGLKWKRSSR